MTSEVTQPQLAEVVPKKVRLVVRLFWWAVCILLAAGGLLGLGMLVVYDHVMSDGMPLAEVDVVIPEGATGSTVAQLLTDQGLIEHSALFRLAIRLDGTGTKPIESFRGILQGRRAEARTIQQGTYTLYQGDSPLQLLHAIYQGPRRPKMPDAFKVTVPEGLTIHQMAELFDNAEAFIRAAHDPDLIARLALNVASLEGFLMPNTYFFDKKPTEREVVERMLQQFLDDWNRLRLELPEARDADVLEVVTLASLIEEEARADEERPLVASVLHNRIEKKMALDMDSTLQYALGKYGQRMLDADKAIDSPYNTYKYPGLPPGPISSPGLRCIRAALTPAKSDYLFFVSNADGKTHTFSETIAEHNAAVARFRTEIRGQRRDLQQRQNQQP